MQSTRLMKLHLHALYSGKSIIWEKKYLMQPIASFSKKYISTNEISFVQYFCNFPIHDIYIVPLSHSKFKEPSRQLCHQRSVEVLSKRIMKSDGQIYK